MFTVNYYLIVQIKHDAWNEFGEGYMIQIPMKLLSAGSSRQTRPATMIVRPEQALAQPENLNQIDRRPQTEIQMPS